MDGPGTWETGFVLGGIAWDSPLWASRGAEARVQCRVVVEMRFTGVDAFWMMSKWGLLEVDPGVH